MDNMSPRLHQISTKILIHREVLDFKGLLLFFERNYDVKIELIQQLIWIIMEYLNPPLVYSGKWVHFFLQVGAQFGGTELCKLNHIFRVKLDLILEIVMVMQAVI
jgi:hypothetical protein